MSAASLFPADDTIANTLGAAFIGFAVSCAAFGIATNQVLTYFSRYPGDRLVYKLVVSAIWVLAAVDQAFIGHAVYFYAITCVFSSFLSSFSYIEMLCKSFTDFFVCSSLPL